MNQPMFQPGMDYSNWGTKPMAALDQYFQPQGGGIIPNLSGIGAGNQGGIGGWWNQNGQGVMQGLGAFTGLASLYSGFKQLGLQEDAFDFQKDAWTKNYNNQTKDYENRLRDRWAARNNSMAARGKEYQSLESYLGDRKLTGEAPAGG